MEPGDLVKRDMSWFCDIDGKKTGLAPQRLFLTKLPDLPTGQNPIVHEWLNHYMGMVLAIVTTDVGAEHLFDFALVQVKETFGWVFADELEVV